MKAYIINLICLFVISCSNSITQKVTNNSEFKQEQKIDIDSLKGDKLISQKTILKEINRTCAYGFIGKCAYENITASYYSIFKEFPDENRVILIKRGNLEISLHKELPKIEDIEEHIKILMEVYKKNKKISSTLIYEYYNDPNTLVAYEKYYYIDIDKFTFYTMYLLYDEEQTTADKWEKHQIDTLTGKIILLEHINNK